MVEIQICFVYSYDFVFQREWFMIIEVRKTIPKTAKEMLIAFFISCVFKVKNEFT